MNYEFRFSEAAIAEARKQASIRAIILLLIPMGIYISYYYRGELGIDSNSLSVMIFPFLLAIGVGFLGIFRAQQRVKNFRLEVTEEELHFMRGPAMIRIAFQDISKVVCKPDGSMLMYVAAAPNTPFLMIPKNLENSGLFLELLRSKTTVTEAADSDVPFMARPVIRNLFFVSVTGLMLVHFLAENAKLIIGSGIFMAGMLIYQFIHSLRFRKQTLSPLSVILVLFLLGIVLFRCVVASIELTGGK